MDKYMRRRMCLIGAIAFIATAAGCSVVKNASDEYEASIQAWNAVHAEQYVTSTCSTAHETDYIGTTRSESVTSSSIAATDTSTTYVTTTAATQPATTQPEVIEPTTYLYEQPCTECGNMTSGAGVYLTDYEVTLLSTLVYLEGGTESYDCQKAIASTVINRMRTTGSTLTDVVYQPGQYSVADKLSYSWYSDSARNAVEDVLTNGTTLPIYVTFFRAGYYHTWGDQVAYCYMDNTYFSYSNALMNEYK